MVRRDNLTRRVRSPTLTLREKRDKGMNDKEDGKKHYARSRTLISGVT